MFNLQEILWANLHVFVFANAFNALIYDHISPTWTVFIAVG